MPKQMLRRTNTSISFGQHYTRKNLQAGKAVLSVGICHGLALAWVQRVHRLSNFSDHTFPDSIEGICLQNRLDYNFNTREFAAHNSHKEIIEEFQCYANLQNPAAFYESGNPFDFIGCYRELGFQAVYIGSMTSFSYIMHLNVCRNALSIGTIKTFLVSTGGHAMAVAVSIDQIAFFDSEEGITIYSHQEGIDELMLWHKLNHSLQGYQYQTLAVVELKYY